MEITYPIMLGSTAAGKATVKVEGLYYRICCACQLPENGKYSVMVSSHDKQQNLGICVPQDDGFGLETRLPIKRIGEGDLAFQIVLKRPEVQGRFYPISSDTPFLHISKLDRACFAIKNGQAGIVVKK